MNTSILTTRALLSAVTMLAAVLATAGTATPPAPPQPAHQCELERIGTQYVHCDDLTGLGAVAPEWIPEQH